jgi:hypothetical protein
MSYPFCITIKFKESPEVRNYQGAFEDAEVEQLMAFLEAAEVLADAEYVKQRMPLEGKISWDEASGFKSPSLPPAIHEREFLYVVRPFLLQKEPTNVERIRSLLKRRYVDPDLRANFDLLLHAYSGKHFQSMMRFSVGGVLLNSDEALDLWLNAHEYHRDAEKRARIEVMGREVPLEVQKVLYLDLLREKVLGIEYLRKFIHCALFSSERGHTVTLKAPAAAAT